MKTHLISISMQNWFSDYKWFVSSTKECLTTVLILMAIHKLWATASALMIQIFFFFWRKTAFKMLSKCVLFLQFDCSILSMKLYYPYCVLLPVLHHLCLVCLGLLSFRAISHFVSFTSVTWFSTAAASVSVSFSLLEA